VRRMWEANVNMALRGIVCVDGTGSASWPMTGFCISGGEPPGSARTVFVNP